MDVDQLKIEIVNVLPLLERHQDDIGRDVNNGAISSDVAAFVAHRIDAVKKALSNPELTIKQLYTLCVPATLDLRQAVKDYPSEAHLLHNWLDAFGLPESFSYECEAIDQDVD